MSLEDASSGGMKRGRDDEEEAEEGAREKDKKLLVACKSGSLDEVVRAAGSGGSVHARDECGRSGLALACTRDDWEEAERIVTFLVGKGCLASVGDQKGLNAVHFAAVSSSPSILRELLKEKSVELANSLSGDNRTPLGLCCGSRLLDARAAAEVLLDCGADVNLVGGPLERAPILLASHYGRKELVSLLLERGCRVEEAVDKDGNTALHMACCNGAFGQEIIPLLVAAGVRRTAKNTDGDTALALAIFSGFRMAAALLPFVVPEEEPTKVYLSPSDPVGTLAMRVKLGYADESAGTWFADDMDHDAFSDDWLWAQLRNGRPVKLDNSDTDVFRALVRCNRVPLWISASREPCFQQHPLSGDTVLHLLCASSTLSAEQKLSVLAELKRDFRNPLIPNFRNQIAFDLATDATLKTELKNYMEFQANRWVMQWYGPVFRKRVFTLLLVLKRLNVNANQDERKLLAKFMSKEEIVYASRYDSTEFK